MYTQCPECHARFRVRAAALRIASGTVRCGRCGSAFNALDQLDDLVPAAPGDERYTPVAGRTGGIAATPGPVTITEFHFTADDIEKVFVDSSVWQERGGAGRVDEAAGSTGAEAQAVVVSESEPIEDITLEGEQISIESILGVDEDPGSTDEFEILEDVPDSVFPADSDAATVEGEPPPETTEAAIAPDLDQVQESTLDILLETAPRTAQRIEPTLRATAGTATRPTEAASLAELRSHRADDQTIPDFDADDKPRRVSRSALAWSLGCLLLALGLLAQVAHQFRQDLVRHPRIGPVLEDVYARLGVPLSPNWDLAAFELRRWSAASDADTDGRLTVRASITNRAAFAQPHPVLRLELDDRYGDSVAVRDFEPKEYLKDPSESARLLGPGASTEAELVVVPPGPDAVGYQLDACLRESAQLLRCAGKRN
jgi:predicted Zn finger-like uncharacterized protein